MSVDVSFVVSGAAAGWRQKFGKLERVPTAIQPDGGNKYLVKATIVEAAWSAKL